MDKCENCRHWEKDHVLAPEFLMDWGGCKLTESESGQPSPSLTRAFAIDAEAYHAILLTAARFYCVQWKAKAEEM